MNKAFLIVIVLFTLLASVVLAEQTQLYSKIFLDPYYRESTTAGTNYTYTLSVNPPDKLTLVYSATITFEGFYTPSVNITLKVNNQTCNTPNYYISTTYASSNQFRVSFDCSNVINHIGNYTIQFSANKNTGAINGWLDLTYTNKPVGVMSVFGTEYFQGDSAKMFLQYLDANNNPVNNSECFLTIWYPNSTLFVNNTLMSHLTEGIYYHNFNAPNTTGVYPASARCYRPLTFFNTTLVNHTTDGFESNNWTGGINWSVCPVGQPNCQNGWDVEDTIPLSTIQPNSSAVCQQGLYCAKITGSYGFMERGVDIPDETRQLNITYWAKIKGLQTNEHFDFFIFDGNWHRINQMGSAVAYGNYTNNVWYKFNFLLDESVFELNNGTLMGWYATAETPSTSDELYIDDIRVDVIAPNISIGNETEYQILMGSGEVHINPLINYTSQFLNLSADLQNLINITTTNQNLLNQILSYLQNTIYPYLTQIWNKLLGIETQLNTTINLSNETLQNTYTLLNITNLTKNDTTQIIDLINSLNFSIVNSTNISINSTGNFIIDNITGLIEYSVISNLKFIGATEYIPAQQGKVAVQFYGAQGQPVNNLSPYVRIFYPDTSLFVNWSAMTFLGNGIYYLNFTAPATYGVYVADAYIVEGGRTYYTSHTFHISEPQNTSIISAINGSNLLIENATANLTSQINSLAQNTTQNFNSTWEMILALNSSQGANNSVILSFLANITQAINNTQSQLSAVNQSVIDNMNSINQSLSGQINSTANATNTLINALNSSTQARFDQIQSYLDNLTILISTNHNITQENISALMEMLSAVNTSITNDIDHLNTSLYDVRADLLSEINQTYNYLVAMNTTINNNLALINASLSGAIQDFRAEAQANFSTMFSTLAGISSDLNGTKADILDGLNNLSTQISNTNQSIQFQLDALNISIQQGFAEKDAHIQSAYDNLTAQINGLSLNWSGNFSVVLNKLDNLSTQIDTNHNITQGNLSAINNYLTNLNASIQQGFTDLNTSISTAEQNVLNRIDLVNASLSQAISDFRAENQANMSALFLTLNGISADLNLTRLEIANLSTQLNQTEQTLSNQLTQINASLSSDLAWLKNDSAYMINFLNDLNLSIGELKINLTTNEALLYSIYNNLSTQIAQNTTAVLNQIIATNQSLSADISAVKNDTQAIITLIGDLNTTMGDQYDNLTIYLGDLQTQISQNHNITQANISTLFGLMGDLNSTCNANYLALNTSIGDLRTDVYGYYIDLNNTLTSSVANLNASINQTGENIVGEITSLRNLLLSINQTLTADIIENRNTMLLINTSLSSQIQGFQLATEGNFNTTFALLNGLEAQNNLTHELLGNLSLQLNQTSWDIQSRIDVMNTTIHNRFDTIDNDLTTIISLLNNLSIESNTSIQGILDSIANLSAQEGNHFNITQQNLTTLFLKCDGLNSTMTGYYQSLYDALAGMNITLNYVNETNSWILEVLNVSTDDLSLVVEAPNRCLLDTNWVAKAQVKDRFGNVLSYLDGVQCNMTTSLWGTSNMSYVFVEQKFKYIHLCDPTNTTFNWSVNCARVS